MRSRFGAAVVALGAAACAASDPPPAPYDLPLPPGFPPMVVPADNPTTEPGVALGRQLYHDVRLSPDGQRACASCHRQDRAFTDPAAPGVLPHVNLAWSRNFLWDGRFVGTLEEAKLRAFRIHLSNFSKVSRRVRSRGGSACRRTRCRPILTC